MKKAINICLLDALTIAELKDDQALVSICDEGANDKFLIPDDHERLIRLRFGDCTEDIVAWRGFEYRGITDSQAKELYKFCKKHKEKNFIVHCTAGVSRSAAICLFLNLCYNHKLKDHFFLTSHPNSRVVYKLLQAYYNDKTLNKTYE